MNTILELLFPQRADAIRIDGVTAADMQRMLDPHRAYDFTALAPFSDPVVRACVHEAKYHNSTHAAKLLAALLNAYADMTLTRPTVVVPVPLSGRRFRRRGYNQVTRVLSYVCAVRTDMVLDDHILVRTRHTQPQTSLARDQRTKNVERAFCVRDANAAARVQGVHVLLVDDVTTTGATLRAAKAALVPHNPASVTCIALAH